MTILQVPDRVREFFVEAGWFPGRLVAVPISVPKSHPAARIWAAFGGLSVGSVRQGMGTSASDIQFSWFEDESHDQRIWSALLATKLIYAGSCHNAHGAIFIASDGRWFHQSDISDSFWFVADTWEEALSNTLLGIKQDRPMLRRGQESVWSYGDEIFADDPRLYHY